ncbi:MAG TPA: helix-turn-helix transcriptional regulator [Gemmatimonadales bacterium]|nr:helix-turn-helix transcriptional regulator [Gemmatimonadales bacterium]
MAVSTTSPLSSLAIVAGRLGISQNEIARRTGLSYQTVNDAWHGRPCTLSTWVKIAKKIPVPLKMIAPLAAEELDGLVIG